MFVLHLSVFALLLTAFICAFGSFTKRFEDNFLQRVGMALLGFACAVRAADITQTQWVGFGECLVYFGVLLFAVGTLINQKHFLAAGRPACLPSSKPTLR